MEEEYCGAEIVEIDPDEGCLTYTGIDDIALVEDEEWEDEDVDEVWDDKDEDLWT